MHGYSLWLWMLTVVFSDGVEKCNERGGVCENELPRARNPCQIHQQPQGWLCRLWPACEVSSVMWLAVFHNFVNLSCILIYNYCWPVQSFVLKMCDNRDKVVELQFHSADWC